MAFENIPFIQAHICVKGGVEAIEFYKKALGAENTFFKLHDDGERVMHANLAIYGGEVMLHDEFPEHQSTVRAPTTLGGTSFAINIIMKSAVELDAAYARAVSVGATSIMEPGDMFWGARYARIADPYGHVWAFNAAIGS